MMSMNSLGDAALVALIHDYTNTHSIVLQGPTEIEYGFGWEPTLTFWSASRRMHLYGDWQHHKQGLTIELAETEPSPIVRCVEITEAHELYDLINRFFQHQTPLQAMTDVRWRADCFDHDRFIPHPPDRSNPANIVEVIRGGELWQPNTAQQTPLSHIRAWLRGFFSR